MKIARIFRDGKEQYGIIKDGSWFAQSVTRNDLGIENFFEDNFEINQDHSEDLENINFSWLPPVARPGKILCVGRNYAEHSREQGKEPETTPLIFSKFATSMIGHENTVKYPSHTENLDYEVELAVIIGKKASKLESKSDVKDYIFGYTIANDLTARDVQKSEKQWTRGKGFDNSLPIGPYIITCDEIDDIESKEIWLKVNGENRQQSQISHMIFSIEYLIHYLSQQITLEPGDILLTGTPEGVGFYMDPKGVLQSRDQVECGVEGIGILSFSISD